MTFFRSHKLLPRRSLPITAALLIAFSFLSAWFFGAKPSVAQQQKSLERYVQTQEREADALLSDTALLRKLVTRTETEGEFGELCKKRFGFFLFAETISETHDLLFWNSQEILPPQPVFNPPDSVFFRHYLNGYYVVHKARIALPGISSNLVGYALIPVLNKFYLETANTQTRFAHDPEAVKRIAIAELRPTEFPVRSVEGQTLFYVDRANYAGKHPVDAVTLVLRLLALLLLLVYLHLIVEGVRRQRGGWKAVALLAAVAVACRVLLFYFPSLFSLRQIPLFDPSVYASDAFNRSLGDLLITALSLCWVVAYAWSALNVPKRPPAFLRGGWLIAAGGAAIFVLIYTTFQLANLVRELVTASKISFDVTNFFTLTIFSVFGFLVLALFTLSYYYFSRLLFRFIMLAFPNLLHLYFAVAIVGLAYLTARSGNLIVLFHIPVLAWLVVYTLLLSQERLIINRIRMTAAGILFWLVVFSVSLAALILEGNRNRELQNRQNIADKLERLNDAANQSMLNVVLAEYNNEFFRANFPRFLREPENQLFRDSIIKENLFNYSRSYATDLYLYDTLGRPLNNRDSRPFEELDNILRSQSKPSDTAGLYYYETSPDQFVYITRRLITDTAARPLGTLFILASPRQFQNADALYPNLFSRTGENSIAQSAQYSFAVYKDKKLLTHSSKYPFTITIATAQVPINEPRLVPKGDNDELWYKGAGQMVVVIAKKKDTLLESITLFSYLFCAFLLMAGLVRVAAFAVRLAGSVRVSDVVSRMNIRTQIHGTIIFISVLSFLIIGAATIQFFITRYNRNNEDRLSQVSAGAVTELGKRMTADSLLTENAVNFSDSATRVLLRNLVKEISDVHGITVNLYDLSGNLQITSDEIIYQRGVLSTRMHPTAFFRLDNQRAVQYVQDEKAAQLNYLSIYTAIRNREQNPYAYLNIPSFTSQIELNQEISNFLITIINLNAFIFLIAGVVALFITNRITNTFAVIGEKMRAITLGKTNEEIVWTRNDEIGELVRQYNKMVHQLEQSATALAKSEREGAWREMARQVAHEIKNPLTPMKLSIQYLQRSIQGNQPNVQQLTSSVASTLIEQIDHLSKIAADFSQFAAIGSKDLQRIDLHGVVRSLVDLYSANPHVEMRWDALPEPLWMRTDKTQMNRLLTNLLTNAVDACSERRKCVVTIGEERKGDDLILSVADNGEGIPADMRPKIFTPNFTTKTSGTGLGLAMCKSIAEQAGGSIWFETKEGEGTTFYVRLPVAG